MPKYRMGSAAPHYDALAKAMITQRKLDRDAWPSDLVAVTDSELSSDLLAAVFLPGNVAQGYRSADASVNWMC